MEATIHITGKKVMKVFGAACLATGVVVLSAVVASGTAVGAVVEGFKSAKNTMQKIMKKDETTAADEALTESADEVVAVEGTADEVSAENNNITEVLQKNYNQTDFNKTLTKFKCYKNNQQVSCTCQ